MKAIMLIGGLGTRLRPFTLTTPKPLLPILNKPFLVYQIESLRSNGIKEIVLCTSYHPRAFRSTFREGRSLGVRLAYVHEASPLGTGGGIKNAEPFVDGTTLICNGDILMNLRVPDLLRFHRKMNSIATIAMTRVKNPSAYGLVETDATGRIRRFCEKPSPNEISCHTINAGVYLFEPEMFQYIPKGIPSSIERDIFPSLLKMGTRMYGKIIRGYWLDVGTVSKYRQAHEDMLSGRYSVTIKGRRVNRSAFLGQKVRYNGAVSFSGKVLIGDHTTIENGVRISGPTVIGRRCRIGKNSIIRRSILMDSTTVGGSCRMHAATIGNGVTIGSHTHLRDGAVIGDKSQLTAYSQS